MDSLTTPITDPEDRQTSLSLPDALSSSPEDAELQRPLTALAARPARLVVGSRSRITADQLWGIEFPEIEWAVPGLIPMGLTILAGKPKVGKSWLVLDLCNAIAHGGSVLGVQCQQGDVLYAALEDTQRRLKDRLVALRGDSKPGPALQFWTELRPLESGALDDLRAWINGADRPRLIVIDVLQKVRETQSRGSNAYQADYDSLAGLKSLSDETGVSIVVVHHLRKAAADDYLEMTSGTNGLTGGADTTLVIHRQPTGTLLSGRGRDLSEFSNVVAFDNDTCRWVDMGPETVVRRSPERTAIIAAIQSGQCAPSEIATATNLKSDNVRQLLGKMIKAGEVMSTARGVYGIPLTPDHIVHNDHSPLSECDLVIDETRDAGNDAESSGERVRDPWDDEEADF